MSIKYVGRTTDFSGKSLWEIVGNLKNYGVGRLVYQQKYTRYPEPCYFKILKVTPIQHDGNLDNPHENLRKVIVLVANVFRGNLEPEVREIFRTSYKPDFRLIPKHEEHKWIEKTKTVQREPKYIDPWIDMPPLMKEVIARDLHLTGQAVTPEKLKLKLIPRHKSTNLSRLADEHHPPTVTIDSFLGTPLSPELYEIKPEVAEYFSEKKPF